MKRGKDLIKYTILGNPDIQVTKKRNQVEKVIVHRFFTNDSKGFGFSMLKVAIKNTNSTFVLTKKIF